MVMQLLIGIIAFFLVYYVNALVIMNSPVKSVLSLMACLICVAVYWLLLGAEFLSLVLVFLYVGAVMTLFLFMVMMLNESTYSKENRFSTRYCCWIVLLNVLPLLLLLGMLITYCGNDLFNFDWLERDSWGTGSDYIIEFSKIFYQEYGLLLQILALILVIPLVVAVGLVKRHGHPTTKRQNRQAQLDVQVASRLSLVSNKGERL